MMSLMTLPIECLPLKNKNKKLPKTRMDSGLFCSGRADRALSGCTIVIAINSLLCLRWFIVSITREKPVFLQTQVGNVFAHTACWCSLWSVDQTVRNQRCPLPGPRTTPSPLSLSLSATCPYSSLTLIIQLSYTLWWQPRNKRWTSDGSWAAHLHLFHVKLYLLTISLRSGEAGTMLRNIHPMRI